MCPFVVIDPTDLGATTVVAPGLMLYNFLSIPDAESLPLHPSVLPFGITRSLETELPFAPALPWVLDPPAYGLEPDNRFQGLAFAPGAAFGRE